MSYSNKVKALAGYLEIKPSEVEEGYDEDTFEAEGGEYFVLTDNEADIELIRSKSCLITQV